jgi:hypothetical protein
VCVVGDEAPFVVCFSRIHYHESCYYTRTLGAIPRLDRCFRRLGRE